MVSNFQKYGFPVGVIFIFGYVLNFLWESFHFALIYLGYDSSSSGHIIIVNYLALMDALVNVLACLLVGLWWKNFFWFSEMRLGQIFALIALNLILSAGIEYSMVYLVKAWSYYADIPKIGGVGALPVLQLGVTGLLGIWMTRRLFHLE